MSPCFGQKVVVREGFYRGQKGILVDQRLVPSTFSLFGVHVQYLLENKKKKFREWIFGCNL